MIRDLFGVTSEKYDTIITLAVLLVLIYGMDVVAAYFKGVLGKPKIQRQLDGLIKDVAGDLEKSEEAIRKALKDRYAEGRFRQMMKTVWRFFAPSRKENNAPVVVGNRRIEREVISELPTDVEIAEPEEEETTRSYENVEIEIHAQDLDKGKHGWAGIPKGLANRRIRMEIYPPIKPDDVWMQEKIRGDILLVLRRKGDELEPYLMHLIRLRS